MKRAYSNAETKGWLKTKTEHNGQRKGKISKADARDCDVVQRKAYMQHEADSEGMKIGKGLGFVDEIGRDSKGGT